MKILQINVVYRQGSTGKIMFDIHTELLKHNIDSIVCYSRSQKSNSKKEYRLCGKFYSRLNILINKLTGNIYSGCNFSTKKLIKILKKEKPDIVHLHCLNGSFINIYKLVDYLNFNKIRTVLTLHAEFMYTGGCGCSFDCTQWFDNECKDCKNFRGQTGSLLFNKAHIALCKMKKSFENFENLTVVGVSDWIKEKAKKSVVFCDKVVTRVHNGIKLDFFSPAEISKINEYKDKLNIPRDKKIVLTVNPRFDDIVKGGDLFLQISRDLPNEYVSVFVGAKVSESRIVSVPYVNNQKDLAILYSMADVFVLCSRSDNYPTVCIEANCCGTPVVGFDVGGVKETIGLNMGGVVPVNNFEKLKEEVVFWANNKRNITKEVINDRRAYCDKSRMTKDYIQIYNEIINAE